MFDIALATVSVAAVLFVWGGVVFVLVLKNYIPRTLGHVFRPAADAKVGWIVVEKLAQSFVLVLLYQHMMPINPLVFGVLTGALLQLTYVFQTWINYKVDLAPVLVIAALDLPRSLVAGLVLGAILG